MSISEKLQIIAENELKVYEAGYAKGKAEGGDGNDKFWDIYQDYGKRTNYSNGFAGAGWTTEILKPKYNIIPTDAYMLFRNSNVEGNLPTILHSLGITLDFSKATNTQYLFNSASKITHIGVVDVSSSTNSNVLDSTFAYATSLVSIEKLKWSDNAKGLFLNTFTSCNSLENVTFEGTISKNGLNLQWSTKLNKDSLTSIINCLSSDTSGLTVTLSKTAVNMAFTENEWETLSKTKLNWTISLV